MLIKKQKFAAVDACDRSIDRALRLFAAFLLSLAALRAASASEASATNKRERSELNFNGRRSLLAKRERSELILKGNKIRVEGDVAAALVGFIQRPL